MNSSKRTLLLLWSIVSTSSGLATLTVSRKYCALYRHSAATLSSVSSSSSSISQRTNKNTIRDRQHLQRQRRPTAIATTTPEGSWQGTVVPEGDGRIRGCTITCANNSNQDSSSMTDWTMAIDGEQADLGRFSTAIYKKFINDAKQQRFQGFRPGTIPPHLEPTYRAFAMDECARETVLEAMQQNSIRPFESCRSSMQLYSFRIPPLPSSKSSGKSKKKKRPTTTESDESTSPLSEEEESVVGAATTAWRSFETMKEAVDAGWKPGQSFSFLAKDIKGQMVKEESETARASPLGVNY